MLVPLATHRQPTLSHAPLSTSHSSFYSLFERCALLGSKGGGEEKKVDSKHFSKTRRETTDTEDEEKVTLATLFPDLYYIVFKCSVSACANGCHKRIIDLLNIKEESNEHDCSPQGTAVHLHGRRCLQSIF